jgi:hypothetical protein
MSEPIRIPLVETIETRLPGSDKDGLSSNVFYDKGINGTTYASKRPGIASYISGSGTAKGIFNYGGELFVYYGEEGLSFANSGTVFNNLFYVNQKFVTEDTSYTSYSTDGIKWSYVDYPPNNSDPAVLTTNGSMLLACSSGEIWYSFNGTTFTQATTPGAPLNAANPAYGNGIWVVGGNTFNFYLTSTDGVTWTSRVITYLFTVVFGGGIFVALRNGTATAGRFPYSTDGINWTTTTVTGAQGVAFHRYGGSKFVGFSNTGTLWQSVDGINWTSVVANVSFTNCQDAVWNGTVWVVLDTNNITWYSSNLTTWTQVEVQNPSSLTYSGISQRSDGTVLVHSGTAVATSTDNGASWGYSVLPQYPILPPTQV